MKVLVKRIGFSVLAVGLLAGLSACGPIVNNHGYVPVEAEVQTLQVGRDTKNVVEDRFGSPTVEGIDGDNSWYYIASRVSAFGPFAPRTVEREILVLAFNGRDVLTGMERYGLADGRVINLHTGETVTGGRRLGFFEQLLGSVGNFSAEQFLGAQQQGF